jgi:hypothetical protein
MQRCVTSHTPLAHLATVKKARGQYLPFITVTIICFIRLQLGVLKHISATQCIECVAAALLFAMALANQSQQLATVGLSHRDCLKHFEISRACMECIAQLCISFLSDVLNPYEAGVVIACM